jgi:hypothetical protein
MLGGRKERPSMVSKLDLENNRCYMKSERVATNLKTKVNRSDAKVIVHDGIMQLLLRRTKMISSKYDT